MIGLLWILIRILMIRRFIFYLNFKLLKNFFFRINKCFTFCYPFYYTRRKEMQNFMRVFIIICNRKFIQKWIIIFRKVKVIFNSWMIKEISISLHFRKVINIIINKIKLLYIFINTFRINSREYQNNIILEFLNKFYTIDSQ